MDCQAEPLPVYLTAAASTYAPRWYVAYTYPRHERAVADQLSHKSVEVFLPTYTKTSRWKDRRVKLDLPLFPGYVFTRMCVNERLAVLSVPSVIRLVSFNGLPIPVDDAEIDVIRLGIARGGKMLPHELVAVGERVRVTEGVFEGMEGIVVRHNNSCKLVVTIALIQQSVALEVEASQLEHVRAADTHASGLPPRHILQPTGLLQDGV
jgi:transcription antitermination factor NusG